MKSEEFVRYAGMLGYTPRFLPAIFGRDEIPGLFRATLILKGLYDFHDEITTAIANNCIDDRDALYELYVSYEGAMHEIASWKEDGGGLVERTVIGRLEALLASHQRRIPPLVPARK